MAMRMSNDVAELESELVILRSDNQTLQQALEISNSEADRLRSELALAQTRAQEELIRSTQIETIMSQVSMGLVAGLKKMQDGRMLQQPEKRVQPAKLTPAPIAPAPHPIDLDEPLDRSHAGVTTVGIRGDSYNTHGDKMPPPQPRQSLREENGVPDQAPAFLRSQMPPLPTRRPQDLRPIDDSRLPSAGLKRVTDEDQLRDMADSIMDQQHG